MANRFKIITSNGGLIKPLVDTLTGLQVQDTDGNTIFDVDTINNRVGIGTTSPGNKLTVTAPTTADTLADVMIGASATTQKGLVIQGKASQTANLQEWQNSGGTILANVDSAGSLWNTVNYTDAVAVKNAAYVKLRTTATSGADANQHTAMDASLITLGTQNYTNASGIRGIGGTYYHYGSGIVTLAHGIVFGGGAMSTGNITYFNAMTLTTYGTGAGTIGTYRALQINDMGAYNSPTTMYGININASAGAVGTSKYGLNIGNISGAATNNYAIYTNTGKVHFGDQVDIAGNVGIGTTGPTAKLHIVGSADTQQLIVKGYSSQTANLQQWQTSAAGVVASVDNAGNFVAIADVKAATYHVGATAGIDATVTYVDTLLGAKTLSFSKGILTAQT